MFHKIMFTRSGYGHTAGLVIDTSKQPTDVASLSRLFPASEAVYMRTLHVSPPYDTWNEAFAHVFPIDIEGTYKPGMSLQPGQSAIIR